MKSLLILDTFADVEGLVFSPRIARISRIGELYLAKIRAIRGRIWWRLGKPADLASVLISVCLLCLVVACATPPTPTPVPPTPTPTPLPTLTPQPAGAYMPSDIPRCAGVRRLDQAPKFDWPGIDDVGDADWYFYQCAQKPDAVAALYRETMVKPPYNWLENAWVVLPEGTLGVYFHTARQNWLYAWFLADSSSPGTMHLVIAETFGAPLDLPCH